MIFKAILLGDMRAMEPDIKEMYQKNGISHLLAISGQHLTIIGGGLYLILRRLGLGFGGSALLGGTLVISYGILTGSSGSAMRAVIMILCLWAGAWAGRTYDSMSALALSAILLLWENPYLLTQSGFQLSFGAVAAIGGLSAWLGPALKLEKMWQVSLLVSLCVQIAITPLWCGSITHCPYMAFSQSPGGPGGSRTHVFRASGCGGLEAFLSRQGRLRREADIIFWPTTAGSVNGLSSCPDIVWCWEGRPWGRLPGTRGRQACGSEEMVWGMRGGTAARGAGRQSEAAGDSTWGCERGRQDNEKNSKAAAGAGRRGILQLALLFLGYGACVCGASSQACERAGDLLSGCGPGGWICPADRKPIRCWWTAGAPVIRSWGKIFWSPAWRAWE